MPDAAEIQRAEPAALTKESMFLAVISRAAADPNTDIDKMKEMLAMQERIMAKQAEIEFNQAMTRLQPRLPVISKQGKITVDGKVRSTFARYVDIDREIRPLLCAEGFSVSFNSELTEKGTVYHGTLAHSAGHSRTASMILPPDASGSKNSIQAIGSTVSYSKRYLLGMLLNLITADEDDDGNGGMLDEHQIATLQHLVSESGADEERFLKNFMRVDTYEQIPSRSYRKAVIALTEKLNEKRRSGADNS